MVKKDCLQHYASLCLWFLLAIIDIRLIEAIFSTHYEGRFAEHLANNAIGVCCDVFYFVPTAVVLFGLFLLLYRKSERAALASFRIGAVVALYAGLSLASFFAQAQFPLDRVVFAYSLAEIWETVKNSSNAAWWMYAIFVLYPVVFFFATKIKLPLRRLWLFAIVWAAGFCGWLLAFDSSADNQGYGEQCNKPAHLIASVVSGLSYEKINLNEVYDAAEEFHRYFPGRAFVSNKCPFLHEKDSGSTLAPFFNLKEEKPNIVMIIVEGLGSENSGKFSRYVSATPFLDSLAEHALNWENCLSVSQRTCGVLPSTFGALPFGRNGFMAYKQDAPEFYSFPKFLEENGYGFSFYYGGWCEFDDMNHFISLHNGKQCFELGFDSLAPQNNWGLLDKFLFSEAIKDIDFSRSPRFEVYMTLTSHDPWDYPDKDAYVARYCQQSQQGKGLNPNKTAAAAYQYVDEALRQLLADYRRKPGFDNTIFIITGDHNFNTNAFILDRYHVPLIVWSPMLKTNRNFPAVVSHRDIPASVIALLEDAYAATSRDTVAWINSQLDTAPNFRSRTFAPQIDPSRNIVSMVYGENFWYHNENYTLLYDTEAHRMSLQKDATKADSVRTLFNLYKKLDAYACSFNALVDSSHIYTSKKELLRLNSGQFRALFPNGKADTVFVGDEFVNILDFPLQSTLNVLNVDFACQCHLQNNEEKQWPMMVVEIRGESDEKLFREAYPIALPDEGWRPYVFNETLLSILPFQKNGNRMLLYIWNPDRLRIGFSGFQMTISDRK